MGATEATPGCLFIQMLNTNINAHCSDDKREVQRGDGSRPKVKSRATGVYLLSLTQSFHSVPSWCSEATVFMKLP